MIYYLKQPHKGNFVHYQETLVPSSWKVERFYSHHKNPMYDIPLLKNLKSGMNIYLGTYPFFLTYGMNLHLVAFPQYTMHLQEIDICTIGEEQTPVLLTPESLKSLIQETFPCTADKDLAMSYVRFTDTNRLTKITPNKGELIIIDYLNPVILLIS